MDVDAIIVVWSKRAATGGREAQVETPMGEPKAKVTREGGKTTSTIDLMQQTGGTTFKEVMEAAGW